MSFDGIDIGIGEERRRKKRSAIPSFTGDLDLDSLARGVPFETSSNFGRAQTQRNLLGQRGRVEATPLRVRAEGRIEDAFLTDPLSAPAIDVSRKSNGKRKKGRSKRDKGRKSLIKESRRLTRGGAPRNVRERDVFSPNDVSFRSLGV